LILVQTSRRLGKANRPNGRSDMSAIDVD